MARAGAAARRRRRRISARWPHGSTALEQRPRRRARAAALPQPAARSRAAGGAHRRAGAAASRRISRRSRHASPRWRTASRRPLQADRASAPPSGRRTKARLAAGEKRAARTPQVQAAAMALAAGQKLGDLPGRAAGARALRRRRAAHRGRTAPGVSQAAREALAAAHPADRRQAAADPAVGAGAGTGHDPPGRSCAGRRSGRRRARACAGRARRRRSGGGGGGGRHAAGRRRRRRWRRGWPRRARCWRPGPRSPPGPRPADAPRPARAAGRGGGARPRLGAGRPARPGQRRDRRLQLRGADAGRRARPAAAVRAALRRVPPAWRG